jgi:EDD domain protein, DegV family
MFIFSNNIFPHILCLNILTSGLVSYYNQINGLNRKSHKADLINHFTAKNPLVKEDKIMLRVFVDSGSSIKQSEKKQYNVEIIPLKILLGDKEYSDGIDLSMDFFYSKLIDDGLFPKTSLPSLDETEKKIMQYVEQGDDVIILPISSGISGTYNTFRIMFEDQPNVRVIDTKTAVGGVRILVEEVNKYRDKGLDYIEKKLNELIPRIRVAAIPETLEYLHRGGRLSKTAFVAGSLAQVKPLITFEDGFVKVLTKAIGLKRAMITLAKLLETECDTSYHIIPSYTYSNKNLVDLIKMVDHKFLPSMVHQDNLDPAIACHWGPGAFGFIFVRKEN